MSKSASASARSAEVPRACRGRARPRRAAGRGPRSSAILDRVRHEAQLDEDHRHVRPVEAREVRALLDAAVGEAERAHELAPARRRRRGGSRRTSSVQPARSAGTSVCVPRHAELGWPSACTRRKSAARALFAIRARAMLPMLAPSVRGPGQHDVDARRAQQPREAERDVEHEVGLADARDDAARPAAVLDLAGRRARPDRLRLGVREPVVAGVHHDDRGRAAPPRRGRDGGQGDAAATAATGAARARAVTPAARSASASRRT